MDSDREQDAIVQNIVAGNSLVVRALPGTGATQTVVNAVGALVAKHKRVLVVTPRKATSDAIKNRLAEAGLGGMAAELSRPGRDLITSIGRNEKAKKPSLTEVDQAYERLRKVILKYREALAKKDAELGVSAMECFSRLGTLSLRESPRRRPRGWTTTPLWPSHPDWARPQSCCDGLLSLGSSNTAPQIALGMG